MAEELKRKGNQTVIIALHPGEVATDMAKIELSWEVEGQLTPKESVAACVSIVRCGVLLPTRRFLTEIYHSSR